MVKSVTKSGDDIIVEYDDGSKITLSDCCKSGGSSGKAVKDLTLKDSTLTISYTDGSADTTVTLPTVEVVDNLTSSDTDKALSAKQGKTLKDVQDTLIKKLEVVAGSSDVKVTLADGTNYTLNLDETHFRGMYGAEGDLPTTGNSEGDYADVDTNGTDVERYIWDKSDSKWVKLKGGGSSTTIVNNLTSTSTTSALSANQGKVLKDEQDKIDARVKKNVKTIENVTDKCQLKITKEDGTSTTIDLNCEPLNKAPVANDHGTIVVDQDTKDNAFTLTCADADGDDTTVTITTEPKHGVITPVSESAGTFTYTPTKGYDGSDNFAYKCRDSKGKTSTIKTGMITVVGCVNDGVFELGLGDETGHTTSCIGEDASNRDYDNRTYFFRENEGCGMLTHGDVIDSSVTTNLGIQWVSYANAGKHVQYGGYYKTYEGGDTSDTNKFRALLTSKDPASDPYIDLWNGLDTPFPQRGYWSKNATDKANGVYETGDGHTEGRIFYIYEPKLADGSFHVFKLDPIEALKQFTKGELQINIKFIQKTYFRNDDDSSWFHLGSAGLINCPTSDKLTIFDYKEISISSGSTHAVLDVGNPPTPTA